jgi:alkanesulfonate monooxygenase SsuD/methylene tetrahydromethanopterin reductase-like flavin-dependent oxidoreductase (luciferase family)
MDESPKMRLAKLARIDRQLAASHAHQAELLAERASVLDQAAEGRIDLATGRRHPPPPTPVIGPVPALVQARAREALERPRRQRGSR